MTENYLQKARKNGLTIDSPISEAELINTNTDFAENWQALIDIKAYIADEKITALAMIDEKYKDELSSAETNYAFMLSISR